MPAAFDLSSRYPLYVEIGADGWCMCHCLELPGATFKAPAAEAGLAIAPLLVGAEAAWAAAHLSARGAGRDPSQGSVFAPAPDARPSPASSATEAGREAALPLHRLGGATRGAYASYAAAVATSAACSSGDTEAFFEEFRSPLTPREVEEGMAYMAASRAELLGLIDALPPRWLEWRPGPGKRSIHELLHHLANAELFYTARLEADAKAASEVWLAWSVPKTPPLGRLSTVRAAFAERLRGLEPGRRATVALHDPHAEPWSPRKVLYRGIWHERYHMRALVCALSS